MAPRISLLSIVLSLIIATSLAAPWSTTTTQKTTSTSTSKSTSTSTSSTNGRPSSSSSSNSMWKASTSSSSSNVWKGSTSTTSTSSSTTSPTTASSTSSPSSTSSSSVSPSSSSSTTSYVSSSSILYASSSTVSAVSTQAASSNSSSACGSATNRACWSPGYNISTNYYNSWPSTGVTRYIYLTVENVTLAPDGYQIQAMAYNGTIPGPTIYANWGDTLVVTIQNNLQNNGTDVHWHGIRQYLSNSADGTAGLTECPVAPGSSKTYTFTATQYGTSWYHSHFSVQSGNGLWGSLVINGPASANYDIDVGPIVLSDWAHTSVFNILEALVDNGLPDPLNGGLINGTNTGNGCPGGAGCVSAGQRFSTTFIPGSKHRLRIINGALQSYFRFSIDSHTLQVIALDFVPVQPYNVSYIVLSPGQRVDVVVTANQAAGNYWLRALYQDCYNQPLTNYANVMGIIHYSNAAVGTPTTSAASTSTSCVNSDLIETAVPYVPMTVGAPAMSKTAVVTRSSNLGLANLLWQMNGSSFMSDWAYPTITQLMDGQNLTYLTNASYADWRKEPPRYTLDHMYNGSILVAEDILQYNVQNQWVYLVLQSSVGLWHPMHLHGHDMWILSQGSGAYVPGTTKLNLNNPPRRDVTSLIPGGHLVIGWITDNPGIWIIHCHIVWHVSQGFALQIVERESEIMQYYDPRAVHENCCDWNEYIQTEVYGQDDSGF